MYVKATIQELESKLLTIQQPMERNATVEVMLRGIEEFQMLLLANPKEGQYLTEVQLISYELIKLLKTGELYSKAI